MSRRLLIAVFSLTLTIVIVGCGKKKYKTPEDIKGTVAWLDARSALPVFPMGTNPIYMFFNADWCKYCQAMKKEIFSRPEIIEYMNKHFTSISVIPDSIKSVQFLGQEMSGAELLKALKVEGYPSHYFFNMKGEVIGVRTGYMNLREFKQLLKYIAEGYVNKMDFATFQESSEAAVDTVFGEF
jgi:thioredoxin-related protein